MTKFVKAKGVWLLLMVLVAGLWVVGCTDEESKTISAIGTPNTLQPKASLQGVVRDLCTGEALSGVRVTMAYDGGLHEWWTDSSGLYAFSNIPVNTSNVIDTIGGAAIDEDAQWDNNGNQYTVVADFTEFLKRTENAGRSYKTTYVGYVMLKYETLHDSIGDVGERNPGGATTYNFTIAGSGAATPVDGLAGGLDILVSEMNASFTLPSVVNAIDNSAISSATFGLYCAYGDADADGALVGDRDDVFIQTINYAGSSATVSGLEGGRVYYLREMEELWGYFNDREAGGAAAVGDATVFFGGSGNIITQNSPANFGDNYAFLVHCNENTSAVCVALIPAPCDDVVPPVIVDYTPKYLEEVATNSTITITFSEAMDTTYPPIETNAEEFLCVAVTDYRVNANDNYGGGNVYRPLSISAAWSADATTITITPDVALEPGSRILVAVRDNFFTDVKGNLLRYDEANDAAMTNGAVLYEEAPLAVAHAGTGLVSMYAWVNGNQTDWIFYVACDETTLALNVPFTTGGTDLLLQKDDVADTSIHIDWNAPTSDTTSACVAAYRIYVATSDDVECEFAILYDQVNLPAGNPATQWNDVLANINNTTGVLQLWNDPTTFGGVSSRTFQIGVAVVNCDAVEGNITWITAKDVTGTRLDPATMDMAGVSLRWDLASGAGMINTNDAGGVGAPNDLYLDCEPPAGYVLLEFTDNVSDSDTSVDASNFVIIQGTQGNDGCTATNLQDPDFSFSKYLAPNDKNHIYLYCTNVFLIDDGDYLSITGESSTDQTGILDTANNPAKGDDTMVMLADELGPAIRNVSLDERAYEATEVDRTSTHFDKVTVTFTEELNADQTTDGWWRVGGAPLDGWTMSYGAVGPFGQQIIILDTIKYPRYEYNEVTGESTVTLYFDDGILDDVQTGDNLTLGGTPANMDLAANAFVDVDAIVLDPGHGDNEAFRAWNDLTDNVQPKIKDNDPDGDGDGDLDGQGAVFFDGQAADFTITVMFSEDVNVASISIKIGNWDFDDDWAVDDWRPNAARQGEYADALSTDTLEIDFDYDAGGGPVISGDRIDITGVFDLAGNSLSQYADSVVAELFTDPSVE